MEVKTNKVEVVDSITVTFNRSEITDLIYCIHGPNNTRLHMLISQMLKKANLPKLDEVKKELCNREKPDTSMWYVTVNGNDHTIADAIGTIKAQLPDYMNQVRFPSWFNKDGSCIGKWTESHARDIQKCLSDHGFECSMIKCSEEC